MLPQRLSAWLNASQIENQPRNPGKKRRWKNQYVRLLTSAYSCEHLGVGADSTGGERGDTDGCGGNDIHRGRLPV